MPPAVVLGSPMDNMLYSAFSAGGITTRPSLPLPPRPTLNMSLISPRFNCALQSPSPRAFEPMTPDHNGPAVPFCSPDDAKGLSLPGLATGAATLPSAGGGLSNDVNVVNEKEADRVFEAARRRTMDNALFSGAGSMRMPTADLFAAPFPGSSTLPTPNLSQVRINQLQQRPGHANSPLFAMPKFAQLPPPIPTGHTNTPTLTMPSIMDAGLPPTHPPLYTLSFGAHGHGQPPAVRRTPSTTTTKSSLGACKKIGKNEIPTCDICNTSFARRSNLYKHLRSVHSTERRFRCDVCDLAFKRADHLSKHMRGVHSKERRFKCNICGTRFAEKYNKTKHVRVIHETKRPYQCPCGAYFQHRDQMLGCLRCKTTKR